MTEPINKDHSDQGELWQELSVDNHWFHVTRSMILREKLREMGLNSWGAYCVIKAHTDLKSGDAWPSMPTIARYMGVSVATAERAVKKLIELGFVERVERRGRKSGTFAIKESIPMTLEGEVVAVGEGKYQPLGFGGFVRELQRFASSGILPKDGKIAINFTVNLIQQGNNGTVHVGDMIVNEDGSVNATPVAKRGSNGEPLRDREKIREYLNEMVRKVGKL